MARPKTTLLEKLYFPAVISGLFVTLKHFFRTLWLSVIKKKKSESPVNMTPHGAVTMKYPEEKWAMPEGYRGAPVLVKDEKGREKCVSCQLCEFVCPSRAIRIKPCEISKDSPNAHIEKAPVEFEIDMLRCIYCGLCEEVCPEQAIFLKRNLYAITGCEKKDMIHNKEKLYELGGIKECPIHKWEDK